MIYCSTTERQLIGILKGHREAISAPELAALLKSSDRAVRAMISHMRIDHKCPICSTSTAGFWFPRCREDAEHTLRQLYSRRNEIDLVIGGILEGLDCEFGSPQLFRIEDLREAS